MIRFAKGHGTENDFVLLPDPDGQLDLTADLVSRLCDRRAGIGADGVLRLVRIRSDAEADGLASQGAGGARWFMDHRNADGSTAQMCGNGIRLYARFLVDQGLEPPGELPVLTRSGIRLVQVPQHGDVTVGMGKALLPGSARTVVVAGLARTAVEVDLGNPHAVVLLDREVDLDALSPPGHRLAAPVVEPPFPDGVNVEYVVRRGERHIAMRVHERGVGETRSCGTGACAAVVAAVRAEGAHAPATYTVDVLGGRVSVTERADGEVELTGPAVVVASGELDEAWLAGP